MGSRIFSLFVFAGALFLTASVAFAIVTGEELSDLARVVALGLIGQWAYRHGRHALTGQIRRWQA